MMCLRTLPKNNVNPIKAALAGGAFVGFSVPVFDSWFGQWGQQSPYGSGNGVIPYDYIKTHNGRR